MNLYEFTNYVNLDIDDVYGVEDIVKWFNKGVASYNIIPPLTKYPIVLSEAAYENTYPLDDNFMLAIMLPFVNSAIMSQTSAIDEKDNFYAEFLRNAREYKSHIPIENQYIVDEFNLDLDNYRLGQNIFISDMRFSPFPGEWSKSTAYLKVTTSEEEEE